MGVKMQRCGHSLVCTERVSRVLHSPVRGPALSTPGLPWAQSRPLPVPLNVHPDPSLHPGPHMPRPSVHAPTSHVFLFLRLPPSDRVHRQDAPTCASEPGCPSPGALPASCTPPSALLPASWPHFLGACPVPSLSSAQVLILLNQFQ